MTDVFNAQDKANDPPTASREIDGQRYMTNAKGAHVPLETIRTTDILMDEQVRRIMGYADNLNAQIGRFKRHTLADVYDLLSLFDQEHGVKMGGTKGNVTLTTFDGTMKVQLAVADQLQDEARFVSRPARQLSPNDPASSRIDVALSADRLVNLVGVLFHTLGPASEYRLSVAGPGGSLAAPVLVGDWTPVHGRMFPSENLPWEAANWWTGAARPEDLLLYPQHLWITLKPGILASALRIELRDPDTAWFDVGGLWVCGAWSPQFNFDYGRELGLDARSVSEEAPSGRMFHEDRGSRRRLTVTWSMLDRNEAMKLFDAGARCGVRRPVVMLPDSDDPVALIREAFPANFEKPPAPRRGRRFENTVSATFKEIIA